MKDSLFIGALGLLPKNLLSRAVGAVAHAPLPRPLAQATICGFAKAYGIDVDEAERPLSSYRHLGDFFTRRLKEGARPIATEAGLAVCPSDGTFANGGRLDDGLLIQAKGRTYHVQDLLRNEAEAAPFLGGSFATIYLSPQNYHRVHHPVEGEITGARYVPGHLWPVNRAAVAHVDDLFCVNERVITYVDTPLGPVATIMVGATSVGYITVDYDESLETNRRHPATLKSYEPTHPVERGDELGIFHLGSTAVVLFGNPDVKVLPLERGQTVKLGQPLARLRS